MEEKSWMFHIGPVWFDGTVVSMTLLSCVIVFAFVFFCTRNLQLRPKGKQNVIEWLIDFVRGILKDNLSTKEVNNFHLMSVTLFLFIFVANEIGLITKLAIDRGGQEFSFWKSPTADPIVTMSLAMMMIVITHFFGVQKFGFRGYIKNSFLEPVSFLLPIKIIEEFTNVITLGLRLYGNIYAGEVLLGLIVSMANSLGWWSLPIVMPLEMIWIGFSLFIGAIQAYVFVTLSMVFMSHKVESEH
ncbi:MULTISPECIES: F0F1 ATP synthase subunit A [Enterococcus]|uniref:F0F1 ATP synthase subunit A n=1 Tax=Enterococcus TaxID=1350 RepID=UPI00137A8AEA|nr:F0F1 ATP synthase subunit A [Enterococcus diestrammenae]KAF1297787.1 F0F1 ATP synthase subunit A [Enterococcus diestrammenae]HIX70725.1 F0F1 ATP synthase subunit A [Candidatus Enterococcus stercoravium]